MDSTEILEELKFAERMFVEMNPGVWVNRRDFITIDVNGNSKLSHLPLNVKDAEYLIIAVHYTYKVVTAQDASVLVLFKKKDCELSDTIELNGAILEQQPPHTANFRTTSLTFYIKKGDNSMTLVVSSFSKDKIDWLWQTFVEASQCSTQKEYDLLKQKYHTARIH